MKKRVLSLLMALALCLTLLPTAALAEENTTEPSTQLTEPTPVPQEPKTPDQGENTETPDQPEEPSQDEPPAADEQPAVQSEPAPQAAEAAEAAVAEVDGVNYDDIQKAFDAVKQSNGGTLTLLANCKTPNTSKPFDISGNYTLDLNGCTLTGRLYLSETSTSLTVMDSSTGGKIQATGSWSPLWVYGGDVTIESGTLATQNENAQALVFGDNDACKTLTITGGSFETGYVNIGASGGKTVISGGAFHELRVNGDSKRVTLSGGTFDTVKRRKSGSTIAPADLLADGYAFVDRDTGAEVSASQEAALTNVRVVSKETVNALVSLTVDGTKTHYGTFEEALTAAQKTQGGTLTLLNNVTTTQSDINSGTFTLDLNGQTLTGEYYNTLVVFGGSLTIQDSKGGVISSTISDGRAVLCCGGNVTILGGSFPSALYWESGTVSLRGGEFRSLDSKAGSWLSAIPEGKALKKKDDNSVVDASKKELITEDGFYVLAEHEKHDWQAGKCACGREHTDHKWKDGECTVCHLPCSHGTIGGDGVCETCGTQFAVKAKGTYYKHLSDALAGENVDDVTLLADDTLSTDVRLERDIMFFPNGHTVSGGGSIVVPSGKRLTFHGNENGETGNAGTIRVEDGGTLRVDEDFTGTVQTLTVSETADIKLSGGTYGTITGSRQKAGTLLKYNEKTGEKYFAFQKQDGTFVRYDQRIPSETPLENVTVVGCPDKGLTEACGETCEYCDGALRCRIGASGYRDMSDAIRDVPDGGTITLLRDYSAVYNISANVDRAYTIDLNGYSVRKNSGGISLVVFAGTPKLMDSKGGGVIAGLEIDSKLGLTLGGLLPEGWDFRNSDGSWLSTTDLEGKTASNVTVAQLPIQSMNYPTEMSMTYGGTGTLIVKVAKGNGAGAVSFQWYKVEDGKETAVGSATTKNQFDLAAQNLSAGQHTFRFSATCDGYKKMSGDIAVTVQRANISASLITPPTAQENLTYTGQEQALIIAGSVADYGTMQYSLTENGTYSPDIPVGTDAGAYTVWYRVIGDENHNDTTPASVAVSIGKKPLTITGVTAASKPYDGTKTAGIPSVTFDGVTLNRGTDYTVAASFDDASVGNGKNVTATVTLMGQAAKNYALEQSSFPTTGSIIKAAAPDFTKETALAIINGYKKTYTVTLPTLPTLEKPKEYGAPTYELGEIKLNDGYYTGGAKVENGELTLPIQKNDVKTTGSVGTATVVIKSTNYEDITLTVKVNAANKIEPTPDGEITATPITYGDTLSNSKISGKMKDPDTGIEVKGTFAWKDESDFPIQTGDVYFDWTFTPAEGYEEYAAVTDIVKVPVAPKSINGATITLEKYEFAYNAAEQSPKITGVTLDNWDETRITYVIKSGDKATDANDSITLTIEGTGNYTGKATVEWKITPREVTPTIEVASCTYTGDALEPTVTVKDDIGNIIDQKEYEIFYSNNTNAGIATVTIKDVEGGNYVLSEANKTFEITKAAAPAAEAGSLTITNGTQLTYTYDFKQLLPEAPNGDYGTVRYDLGNRQTAINFTAHGYYLDPERAEFEGSKLTLVGLYAKDGTATGQIGTVKVNVTTTNYENFQLTLVLNAVNQIKPTPDGEITAAEITYGDALSKSTILGKMKDPDTGKSVNGTFAWADGTIKPNAGDYEADWTFTPAAGYEKYATATGTVTIKVNKATPTFTAPTAQENLTYTGQPQALITASSVTSGGTMQYSLTENGTYSQDIPTGTDAGAYTVWYRVIGDENHNDTTPASVPVRIGQKPLTITGVTAASKPYDGTTNADISSVTFDGVNLNRGTDYTVTANFDDAGVGSGKSVTATVTLMEQAAKNYALEQSSFPTTGSIIKAAAPDFTKETALTIVNGHEKTYTVTLPALPTLETPKEYGALTYEIGEIKLNDGYYTSGAKVENGELTLPIQKNDVETTGSVGTVTVVIKSANYEDITLTVNVSAKNKLSPVLAGTLTLTPIKITYGEPLSKIKITGTMKAGDTVVEGTFSWQQPGDTILDASTSGHDVGWTFTPKDGNTYTEVTGTATVKVNKARQSGEISMTGYTYGQMPSMPSLTEQTGDANAQVTYRYSAAGSGSVQTWDIQNPPALNAGTYRMYASIGDTDNYYGFEAAYCEFVVAKATPTYTAPTGLTAKYGQTLADVTLPDGWSWTDSSESVGGASTAAKTFQAKFTPKDTENYNTVENIELEVTVNKADGGNLKTVELEQKYTDASDHTYTPDWAGLPAGQDWTFSSEASIVLPKQDFAADGNLLTYAISGGKAGDKITIILKASCNNYEDFTITLTITLTEKDNQQALRITGGTTVVYGQTLQLGTSGGTGSGAVTYTVTNGTGEATIDSNGVLTPVRIGSVTVTATKAGDSEYNAVTSSPVEITITRATPTGEPAYTKITASGKTLADAALGIGTITPAGGTIAWDDPTTTEVVANKSYGWTYTPSDTNYTTLTGSIQLWHKSTSSGGGSYYAPTVPDMPMLYRGCTGDAVKTLQDKLNTLGYNSGNVDGIFGAKTYAAVTAFQKANNLGVDGIVGKLTWAKLYGVSPAMPVETTTVVGRPMVSYGSRGDAVRKLQELLNALGYDCGSVDGIFGSKTKAAVLAFQKANGLGADGIVGPLTWGKLV